MRVRYDMVQCHVVRQTRNTWEFLQLLRAAGRYMAGTWQIVSGSIENEETAWQAALRELAEETALRPAEFYKLDMVDTFYIAGIDTMYHAPVFCAIVSSDANVTLNDEHTQFRWVDLAAAELHVTWPSDARAIREISRDIPQDSPAKPYLRISLDSARR